MFTFTHPFKGIHRKFKGLKDRMINKLPVFANNPDLKIPRCYIPISNNSLANDFKKLYIDGERFIFSVESKNLKQIINQPVAIQNKITEKNIIITPVLNNSKIIDIYFNNELGFIKTQAEFLVYSAKNRGYLSKIHVINSNDYDDIFIGNENILLRKNNILFHFKNEREVVEIKNFKLSNKAIIVTKENILIVIEEDKMFWLFIDEIYNNSIKNQRYEVFGKGFNHNSGFVQNSGGKRRVFHNSGNNISNIKIDKNIKYLYQNKNMGLIQYVENKLIINKYFIIRNNQIMFSQENVETFTNFAFLKTSKEDGLIFEAANGEIKILRTNDFKETSKIECSYISAETSLNYCKSGIIAHENQTVLLINSRQ